MKREFFAGVLMLAAVALYAQRGTELPSPDVPLAVGVDSYVWASSPYNDGNATRRLGPGETVLGDYAALRNDVNGIMSYIAHINIRYNNARYTILTRNLIPQGEGRLPKSWITVPDGKKKWIISYYLDALGRQDREVFIKHEKNWYDARLENIEGIYKTGEYERIYNPLYWYDSPPEFESVVFFDAVIVMGGFDRDSFFITDITPYGTGYKITVTGDRSFIGTSYWNPLFGMPFPPPSERRSFDMIFIPDGDYMDVYLDSTDSRFATFANVDAVFLEELEGLMRTDTVNLSNITFWPRRADGSTDYPPPDGAMPDFQASQKTHGELALPIRPRDRQSRSQTTDRLRVRENPDTGSAIVTILDTGTKVQILETGTEETIGGITAPWVKVLSENGFTGWAFSGYLETLNPETQNQESVNANPTNLERENVEMQNQETANANPPNPERENVETQNLEAENQEQQNPESSFPVLPFAITGSAILVSGIAVVLAKRKKGKGQK